MEAERAVHVKMTDLAQNNVPANPNIDPTQGNGIDVNPPGWQMAGEVFGTLSLVCFIVLMLPQIYKNYKRKDGDALSSAFLWLWIVGDFCSLLGLFFIAKPPPLQVPIHIWFFAIDFTVYFQMLYYRRRKQNHRIRAIDPEDMHASQQDLVNDTHDTPKLSVTTSFVPSSGVVIPISPPKPQPKSSTMNSMFMVSTIVFCANACRVLRDESTGNQNFASRALLSVEYGLFGRRLDAVDIVIGQILGYTSSILFGASRFPQIWKNYKAKTCEGVSLLIFIIGALGNIFYAASILCKSLDPAYITGQLSWLLGTLGTLPIDGFVIFQFYYYKPRRRVQIIDPDVDGEVQEEDDEEGIEKGNETMTVHSA